MQHGTSTLDYKSLILDCLQDLIKTTQQLKSLPVLGAETRNAKELKTKKTDLLTNLFSLLTNLIKSVSIDSTLDISNKVILQYLIRVENIITDPKSKNTTDLPKLINNLIIDFKTFDSNCNLIKEGLVNYLTENFLDLHVSVINLGNEKQRQLDSFEKNLKSSNKELNKYKEFLSLETKSKEQIQLEFENLKDRFEKEHFSAQQQKELYDKENRRLKDQVAQYLQHNVDADVESQTVNKNLQSEVELLQKLKSSLENELKLSNQKN